MSEETREPRRRLFGRHRPKDGLLSDERTAADEDAQQARETEAAHVQLEREAVIAAREAHLRSERLEAEQAERDGELAKLMLWTDTHCHLQYAADGPERVAVVRRAVEAGVRRMVCVGTDLESSEQAVSVAAAQTRSGGVLSVEVYATVGLHPHDATQGASAIASLLSELDLGASGSSRVVAVGECGLDYHYDHSPRSTQRKVFAAQVALANEHGLALVIHTREAFSDTLGILEVEGVPERTIFHCFTGGPGDAERCLATGAYLSFSGIATFSNADDVRQSLVECPLDRILVETDSPYLTPVPHRGRPNEPAYVTYVGDRVASLKGLTPDEVASATTSNATAAFGLAPA